MNNMFATLIVQEKPIIQKPVSLVEHYTWFEFLEVCKEQGITTQDEYNKYLPFDTKLPSGPSRKYQRNWNAAGGWKGIVQEYSREYYSFPRFLELCKTLGIRDMKPYEMHAHTDTKLPTNPSMTYYPQWQNLGGWDCLKIETRINHVHLSKEYYSFDEFIEICKEKEFTGRRDYRERYQFDPKLPSHPETHYKDMWEEKGGWVKICGTKAKKAKNKNDFCIPYKKMNTLFEEFIQICKEMKILSRRDYYNRYKQNAKLASNPEKHYREWFEKVGGWGFVTGKDFYPFPLFLEVCKGMKFVNREDYKHRYTSDKKLTRFPSILYGDEWIAAGGWKCISSPA